MDLVAENLADHFIEQCLGLLCVIVCPLLKIILLDECAASNSRKPPGPVPAEIVPTPHCYHRRIYYLFMNSLEI